MDVWGGGVVGASALMHKVCGGLSVLRCGFGTTLFGIYLVLDLEAPCGVAIFVRKRLQLLCLM